jgi:hypothetical protein
MGCRQDQRAGLVESRSIPSLLTAPPRLPAPDGAAYAERLPDPTCTLGSFDLPDPPPRA